MDQWHCMRNFVSSTGEMEGGRAETGRSDLKKIAINTVKNHYDLYPHAGTSKTPYTYLSHVKKIAAMLLGESNFLKKVLFKRNLPLNAVVVATTVIMHILKAVSIDSHTKAIPLSMATTLNNDPHHEPRLWNMTAQWAAEALFGTGMPNVADSKGLGITLKL
ncbi:hypothetical protein HYDPIDRAFT_164618 [Hydnomerulius pinastri MD-312]|nr:hypothetical protein HYDPIDRAFT_164618 [Hydnomerulius pinastri MD-312]